VETVPQRGGDRATTFLIGKRATTWWSGAGVSAATCVYIKAVTSVARPDRYILLPAWMDQPWPDLNPGFRLLPPQTLL
jgi:hypothetical protein